MPWCPKCKNEYVDGVKTCVDCGCDLVGSLEEMEKEGLIFGTQEEMEELLSFLSCNGIKSGELRFDETEDLYELFVSPEEKGRASRYSGIFQKEKNLREKKKAINNNSFEDMQEELAETEEEWKLHRQARCMKRLPRKPRISSRVLIRCWEPVLWA